MLVKEAQKIAMRRYEKGEPHSVSTAIDDDTILAGYGSVGYDDFEFPLPDEKVIELYGTLSWAQYFKNKGLYRYETVNEKTGEMSISPLWNDDELEHHKKINIGFTFKKIE